MVLVHSINRNLIYGLLHAAAAAAAKSLQSCPTLCDPIDGSPPGSSVPGILQARILEWVAVSFSNACMLSRFSPVRPCVTPWTAAHQAPLSTGFSRQEHWSGLPVPSLPIMLAMSILLWTLNIQQKFKGSPVQISETFSLCSSVFSCTLSDIFFISL